MEITNRSHLETSIHVTPLNISNDIFIKSQRGDRLDLLANAHYGDPNLWYIIANANNIPGTMMIKEGTELKIPYYVPDINDEHFLLNNEIR